MRRSLLLVLASLSASAAEPKPCAKEEAEEASALEYLVAAYDKADGTVDGFAEQRFAEHVEVLVARRRLEAARNALKKCRAGKVTP